MTLALIDGDIVAYRCAASAEHEDFSIASYYVEKLIELILLETGATSYNIYLSGDINFRYNVYPEYKANRKDTVRPKWLLEAKELLKVSHKATVADGCEADDLLGIAQCSGSDTIICSLDKDLLMIPGNHYSWEISGGTPEKRWTKPASFTEQTEWGAIKHFYTQLLTGDPSDNIKGAAGIGKVKAKAIIDSCNTEQELFEKALSAYNFVEEEMLMNGKCLWIWRKEGDIWEFPKFETNYCR